MQIERDEIADFSTESIECQLHQQLCKRGVRAFQSKYSKFIRADLLSSFTLLVTSCASS